MSENNDVTINELSDLSADKIDIPTNIFKSTEGSNIQCIYDDLVTESNTMIIIDSNSKKE
jgi:hypothetical protein